MHRTKDEGVLPIEDRYPTFQKNKDQKDLKCVKVLENSKFAQKERMVVSVNCFFSLVSSNDFSLHHRKTEIK